MLPERAPRAKASHFRASSRVFGALFPHASANAPFVDRDCQEVALTLGRQPTHDEMRVALSQELLRRIAEEGAEEIAVNCCVDPPTEHALRRYQEREHLPVTGQLDEETLTTLTLSVASSPAGLRR